MVTLLLTALAIFAIIGTGLYFWQKSAPDNSENILPPYPEARGLFDADASLADAETRRLAEAAAARNELLLSRARSGEREALTEAHATGDPDLYDQVLNELASTADSDPKLLALVSYVSQNDLPVNAALARAVLASWKESPDRNGTSKALHFAALSDIAEIYSEAIESALRMRRDGKLQDISATELRALFDGEFWILSSRTRSSGAGFALKQTLANARRELEAATSAHQ